MDHTHILDLGSFFILVDSFPGWPEILKMRDRKATTVRQILRTIFARSGVLTTIVMDNAPEFYDESLVSWLRKIGCMPYKTPPFHSQSNGIVEKDGPNCKNGFKGFFTFQQEYRGIHS